MTLATAIKCVQCGKEFSPHLVIFECAECCGSLDIVYDYDRIRRQIVKDVFLREKVTHWKYAPFFPIADLSKVVTLEEGGTPLIESSTKRDWLFKYEGINPTCSFKDRGSTVEVSKANELGIKEVACATTGNMGASVATYCARAGIQARIFVPSFAAPAKLKQIADMGAKITIMRGTYDDAVQKTKELRVHKHIYLTGDYAYRGEGEKSVGFEIIDQFNWQAPDYIVLPVGNATLFSSTYKALMELKTVGLLKRLPKLVAVQAAGCAPLVRAYRENADHITPIKKPKTVASAIACGNPVDGLKALRALKKTKGLAVMVTDQEALTARKELATKEGVYVEVSGAVSYAGAKKLGLKGQVVCVLTGHGLKGN
ncbi:threonine synthase [Candidatus Woesearchaeota archaeon]|nr:threonine synthase [Candidatus Woesearchaeota archaeon]